MYLYIYVLVFDCRIALEKFFETSRENIIILKTTGHLGPVDVDHINIFDQIYLLNKCDFQNIVNYTYYNIVNLIVILVCS